jgi:hypothetical protein
MGARGEPASLTFLFFEGGGRGGFRRCQAAWGAVPLETGYFALCEETSVLSSVLLALSRVAITAAFL